MKTQHTSGKWFMRISKPLLPGTKKQVHVLTDFGSSTQTICQLSIRKGETKANAKLIAAAPELLEACKNLTIQIYSWKKQDKETLGYKWALALEKAIKKATE